MSIKDQIVITGCLAAYEGRECLFFSSEITDDGEEFVHIVFQDQMERLPADGLAVLTRAEALRSGHISTVKRPSTGEPN